MAFFKDCNGKNWEVSINIKTLKRVKNTLGIDLLDLSEGGDVTKLEKDIMLRCDVLYLVCQDECEKSGISDEQFGESLIGQAIEDAQDAFIEALINFYPPRQAEIMRETQRKVKVAQDKTLKMMGQKLSEMNMEEILSGKSPLKKSGK